jgi:phosphate transport system permease protein
LERATFWVFRLATYLVLACGLFVFGDIIIKGSSTVFQREFPFVNTTFLTHSPESLYVFEYKGQKHEMGDTEFRAFREGEEAAAKAAGQPAPKIKTESYVYSAGGIWPCIVGTVLLVVGSMTIALALGVSSAIYLSEYARDGRFVRFIRLAILNLAGVPSIVFGLFGLAMFVLALKWNVSLIAGWFTLAFMVLPVVITASEEALKSVPKGFRDGSLALGATKWQTIRSNVLPYALPGILTSSILGIARVAGETAPIMFTAAYVVRDKLPWEVDKVSDFFFQGVMALPYHIYVVSSKIPQNEYTEHVQYGTAFVFLMIVGLIAATSIVLRNKLRGTYKW